MGGGGVAKNGSRTGDWRGVTLGHVWTWCSKTTNANKAHLASFDAENHGASPCASSQFQKIHWEGRWSKNMKFWGFDTKFASAFTERPDMLHLCNAAQKMRCGLVLVRD